MDHKATPAIKAVKCGIKEHGQVIGSAIDAELIAIPSNPVNAPCDAKTTEVLYRGRKHYDKEMLKEVDTQALMIKAEIGKTPVTDEEIEFETKRKKELEEALKEFPSAYPRFSISPVPPKDHLYYGIHPGEYKDVPRFLGERACANPLLSYANTPFSYLGLFFTLNVGRNFGGVVRIINERIITLVEGNLTFYKSDNYYKEKRTPDAEYDMWVHEDLERDYKGWVYERQRINQIKSYFDAYQFLGPWLYNSCNKSIATVNNFCSLDPSFDMEVKEFFYLTDYDLMVGNIYCKRSHEISWKRMATLEFVRI